MPNCYDAYNFIFTNKNLENNIIVITSIVYYYNDNNNTIISCGKNLSPFVKLCKFSKCFDKIFENPCKTSVGDCIQISILLKEIYLKTEPYCF